MIVAFRALRALESRTFECRLEPGLEQERSRADRSVGCQAHEGLVQVRRHSPCAGGGTHYALAVLGKGRFDKHGAQGEAQVVFCVAHAELPSRKTGLETQGRGATGLRPSSRPLLVWEEAATAGARTSFQNFRETFLTQWKLF